MRSVCHKDLLNDLLQQNTSEGLSHNKATLTKAQIERIRGFVENRTERSEAANFAKFKAYLE